MKYEPQPRPQRSALYCSSANSFASYPFRTLASHLKATVSSNSFEIKRFRTLCKIPGIGYPLPFFFSALSWSDLFNFPLLPCVLRAPDLRSFLPRLPRASAKGARVSGARRCPNHSSPTLFRINTCKSVTKQTTLTFFRINTYEKYRGGSMVFAARSLTHPGPFPTLGLGARPELHIWRREFRRAFVDWRRGSLIADPSSASPRGQRVIPRGKRLRLPGGCSR
jgi:hypothetical protein